MKNKILMKALVIIGLIILSSCDDEELILITEPESTTTITITRTYNCTIP